MISTLDVRKAAHLFQQLNIPILGLVENMSYLVHKGEEIYPFGEGGGENLAGELGIPFLEKIPIDKEISLCGDEGKSLSINSDSFSRFVLLNEKIVKQIRDFRNESDGVLRIDKVVYNNGEFLKINWNYSNGEGKELVWSAFQLQKNCPCANCTLDRKKNLLFENCSREVKIQSVEWVGRYGIKIQFSKGCSAGIFSFDYLRSLQE